ncbi:MAG TPA: sulfite exporter TauE/SafE family protein [Saprospiraceae bacterium]|nr:sulfite exporter TauE/SafE family protein [Saprospiraceae bacterium]
MHSTLLVISPDLTWVEWSAALLAAMIVGVGKAGIKGIDAIVVTILALIFGSKASTGILVPMLIVGDVFAVVYYHRHALWQYFWQLLPWMIAGILLGVWFGKDLPEDVFRWGLAAIILVTVILLFWMSKRQITKVPTHWSFGGAFGLMAGFTTMVGNLAGAFANVFFLAMQLPKNAFVGTGAWLFLCINVFKLPFHIFVWHTITWESIQVDLRLLPGIFAGLGLGIFLMNRINDAVFRRLILILTAIGAVLILFR